MNLTASLCPWLIVFICFLPAISSRSQTAPPAPEVEAIRKEMEQLRRDYEERIKKLEDRLKAVETARPATPSAAVPAIPVPTVASVPTVPPPHGATNTAKAVSPEAAEAAAKARDFAREQFTRTTESRERSLATDENQVVRARIEKVLNDYIDFGGYFRAGYGRNNQGGPQAAFQAPGALAKYRLGNETENYGELILGKDWWVPGTYSLDPKLRPDGTPEGPVAHAQLRMAFVNPYSSLNSGVDTQVTFPEAWASIGNVLRSQPSLKFWAGNRFYRRHDVNINDFYYYNMSGAGGGVEDLQLSFGKVALAWIGSGSQSGLYSEVPQPDPKNTAGFSKANVDLSLYDVKVPLGTAEFGLIYSYATAGFDSLGQTVPDTRGFSANFIHTSEKFFNDTGVNKFSAQYGRGPGLTLNSGFETITLAGGTYIRNDPDDAWRVRLTESFIVQAGPHFSIGPALVYQYTDYGGAYGRQQWFSAGVRPIYHFNKYFGVAFEGGVDWVDDQSLNQQGNLYKLTISPQVSLGDLFLSRPVIRAYATWAHWSNEFIGKVGGQDFIGLDNGWGFGMQVETWW